MEIVEDHVHRVEDGLAVDPVAQLRGDRAVERNAVDEAGATTVGGRLDRTQDAGAVELVVVAVVEVPRQPLRQLDAVEPDLATLVRLVADLDDAELAAGAGRGLARVVLERSE